MIHKIFLVLWIAALLMVAPVLAQNAGNSVNGGVPVTTGADLLSQPVIAVQHGYVVGVIDGALVTDTAFTFMCDDVTRYTKEEIAEQIIAEITADPELQKQPIVFSILNGYNKLYCPKKTPMAPHQS